MSMAQSRAISVNNAYYAKRKAINEERIRKWYDGFDKDKFIELFPSHTNAELSNIFNISINSVSHRAQKFNLYKSKSHLSKVVGDANKKKKSYPFSHVDLKLFVSMYPEKTNKELCAYFGFNEQAIKDLGRRLGLKKTTEHKIKIGILENKRRKSRKIEDAKMINRPGIIIHRIL